MEYRFAKVMQESTSFGGGEDDVELSDDDDKIIDNMLLASTSVATAPNFRNITFLTNEEISKREYPEEQEREESNDNVIYPKSASMNKNFNLDYRKLTARTRKSKKRGKSIFGRADSKFLSHFNS